MIFTRLLPGLFLALTLLARTVPQTCGTRPGTREQAKLMHEQNWRSLGKPAGQRLASASVRPAVQPDQGQIAILDDADGVVARQNLFNLENRQIRFTAGGTSASSYQFVTATTTFDEQARQAPPITIGDDDSRPFTLPFDFPFYGKTYRQVFVNSDGNITFNEADNASSDRSLGRVTSGPPRIAALFRDLDPSRSGTLRIFSEPDRWVASWTDVPEFRDFGLGPRNTFQIRIFPDGRIELIFGSVASFDGVTGISPGQLQGTSRLVDFTVASTDTFTGTVATRFTLDEAIDIVAAAQKFYLNHDDAYDFLFFFNALNLEAASGAVAFMVPARSATEGINDFPTSEGTLYGSARRLQGVINMGPISQYPRDPNGILAQRGLAGDTPLTVLAHEAGHLWLAFVSVTDELGRPPMLNQNNFVHWAFTFNSEASLMEGNRIQDDGANANPRFRTVGTVEGYAPLDQYLMGLRAPADVPPSFYVANSGVSTASLPRPGFSFNGQRHDVSVDDIIRDFGPRRPDHTVSQRQFRFAFVLIGNPTPDQVAQVEGYRAQFEAFFARATNDRARAETRLLANLYLTAEPFSGILAGASGQGRVTIERARSEPLTVTLASQSQRVEIPASVTIPAGQTSAAFNLRGLTPGVDLVTATATDAFVRSEARIQVVEAVSNLQFAARSGQLQFYSSTAAPLPLPVRIAIVSTSGVPFAGQPVAAQISGGGTITPASDLVTNDRGEIEIRWTPGPGDRNQIVFSAPGIQPLTVRAFGPPAVPSPDAVVNGASFQPGLVGGSLASLFGTNLAPAPQFASGSLPTQLGVTSITINGFRVPLVFVSENQINFLMPTGFSGDTVQVSVVTPSGTSAPVAVPLRTTQPAIFFDAASNIAAALVSGTGQSTITRPIARGEFLEIFATGLGTFSAGQLVNPVRVFLGDQECPVSFAGLAPGFSGLYQVNVQIPSTGPSGELPLRIQQGSQTSNQPLIRVR